MSSGWRTSGARQARGMGERRGRYVEVGGQGDSEWRVPCRRPGPRVRAKSFDLCAAINFLRIFNTLHTKRQRGVYALGGKSVGMNV